PETSEAMGERADRGSHDRLLISLRVPVSLLGSSPHYDEADLARHARTRRGCKIFHRPSGGGIEWRRASGAAAMTSPKQVALLIETSNAYARGLLRGVMAYVHAHDPWVLRLAEHGRGEVSPTELADWNGDGLVARIENPRVAEVVRSCGRPTVDVSAARLL